jgi:hypothetical protein
MEPRWLCFGDSALATALVKAAYDAKNEEEYRLRKEALLKTMEADRRTESKFGFTVLTFMQTSL